MLEDVHAETYRVYVSDALRIISENTARFGGGTFAKQRYYDVINPPKVDERSGDEIAADIIERAGLRSFSEIARQSLRVMQQMRSRRRRCLQTNISTCLHRSVRP